MNSILNMSMIKHRQGEKIGKTHGMVEFFLPCCLHARDGIDLRFIGY